MGSCVLPEKAPNTEMSCFIYLVSAEILYTAPRKRVIKGPKPEKFPPKYILIKRTCQTQTETDGFLTVFSDILTIHRHQLATSP